MLNAKIIHSKTVAVSSCSLLALCCAAITTPAFAQDAEETDENIIVVTATQRSSNIQDIPIAVTAITPVQMERQGVDSITALTSISTSVNFSSSNSESQGTTIRIRGIGTSGNTVSFESATAVFVDGAYQSRPGVALGELVDVQQVEVLRGPQGTLFGRNTTAGALVVRNTPPDLNEFGGFGVATYGNYDLFNVQGAVNVPLVQDQLGVRVTGSLRKRDGYVTSATDGVDYHNKNRWLVRGQLLWEPSSDISLKISGDYQKSDEDCCSPVILDAGPSIPPTLVAALYPAGTNAPASPRGGEFPYKIKNLTSYDNNTENVIEQWGVTSEVKWDFGPANLTVIGSYRDFIGEFRSGGYTALDVFGLSSRPGDEPSFDEIKTWTGEARLQGSAFDDVLDWLVGVYYSDEKISSASRNVRMGNDWSAVSTAALGLPLPPTYLDSFASAGSIFLNGVTDPANAAFGAAPFQNFENIDQTADNRFKQDSSSFSIFTHNIFNVTDTLSLTVGARYVDDKKDAAYDQISSTGNYCVGALSAFGGLSAAAAADAANGNTAATDGIIATLSAPGALGAGAPVVLALQGAGPLAGLPVGLSCIPLLAPALNNPAAPTPVEYDSRIGLNTGGFKDEEFIYTLQGAWKATPDVLIYGGFTHGYKAGGFNLDATGAIGGGDPRFGAEEIDSYEIGLKSTLLDGRVRANISLFHSDISGFQVLEFDGVRFQVFNVDDVTSKGVEVELFGQWSDYISTNASVTYNEAEYGANCAPAGTVAAQYCGNPLSNAPEWVGVAGMTYDGPINGSDWSMLVNVNLRYESDRRTSSNPTEGDGLGGLKFAPYDYQDANFKVNARLGFTTPDERFTLELWGKNLTNEITRNITFPTPFIGNSAFGNAGYMAVIDEPRTYGVTVRGKF